MRVLVCDDVAALRRELRIGLEAEGFDVVGEAGDGVEAEQLAGVLAPDGFVVDLSMPGRDGLELVGLLRDRFPAGRIVVFSGFDAARMGAAVLRAGADVYLEKGCAFAELVDALRSCGGHRPEAPTADPVPPVRPHGVLDALVDAYERSLTRVAENLHDGPIQTLSAVAIMLSKPGIDPQRQAQAAAHLAAAVDELRDLMDGLATWDLAGPSLAEAIRALVEAACSRNGIEAEIELTPQLERIPAAQAAVVFRTVQEAVTNAIKHGRPRRISVSAAGTPESLEVRIADDGSGFDTSRPVRAGHLGLPLARRRLEALSGRLELTSRPGAGTQILVSLPLLG